MRRGLAERIPDAKDRRAARLVLTPEGSAVQRRIDAVHAREITDAMTRNLSVDELEQLRSLCTKLIGSHIP